MYVGSDRFGIDRERNNERSGVLDLVAAGAREQSLAHHTAATRHLEVQGPRASVFDRGRRANHESWCVRGVSRPTQQVVNLTREGLFGRTARRRMPFNTNAGTLGEILGDGHFLLRHKVVPRSAAHTGLAQASRFVNHDARRTSSLLRSSIRAATEQVRRICGKTLLVRPLNTWMARYTSSASHALAEEPAPLIAVVSAAQRASPTFDEVYETQFAFVWRTLRRLGVQETNLDDAAQDVFVVVRRRLSTFEQRAALKTWLFGIVLRVSSDYRRASRRKGVHSLFDEEGIGVSSGGNAADSSEETIDACRVFEQLMQRLPDDQRGHFPARGDRGDDGARSRERSRTAAATRLHAASGRTGRVGEARRAISKGGTMKPLSPAARSVVDALRDVAPPTPSDSDRVRALLKARLVATGTTGQPSSIAPVGSTFGKASLVKKLFGVLLLVGSSAVVRHAYVQSLSPSMPAHAVVRAPDQVREHVVASVTPAVDVPRPETPDPIVAASSPNTATTRRAARTSHARPSAATRCDRANSPGGTTSIAQEMEILRTAEDALRSGECERCAGRARAASDPVPEWRAA